MDTNNFLYIWLLDNVFVAEVCITSNQLALFDGLHLDLTITTLIKRLAAITSFKCANDQSNKMPTALIQESDIN